jgi:hypothetical protein
MEYSLPTGLHAAPDRACRGTGSFSINRPLLTELNLDCWFSNDKPTAPNERTILFF